MRPRLDPDASPAARLFAAAARLGCSPSEAVALAILATAALAGLGLLWWAARPAPAELPADATGAGEEGAAGPAGDPGPAGSPATPPGGIDVRDGDVVVHVAGQVSRPGLYELPGGARVADALEAAGGPLPDALLDHLNLARTLSDGEQLRVPGPEDLLQPGSGPDRAPGASGPGAGAGPGTLPGPSPWRSDGTLDLNLATAADLQELPGIGPVMSERIVAHREQIGGFTAVGQLREVSGIGEKTFHRLAELVSV